MSFHVVDYALWVASTCLQIGVLIAMYRRGINRRFPFFFRYTILQVASMAVLAAVMRFSYGAYYYSYWVSMVLSVLISFAVVDELFVRAFRDFSALRNLGRIIFRWAVFVVLLAACVSALESYHPDGGVNVATGVLVADRSARAMLCSLAILLLLGSHYLQVSRGSLLFGITLGFAIFTLTRVASETVVLRQAGHDSIASRLNSLAYVSSCGIWLAYAILADRKIALAHPRAAGVSSDIRNPRETPVLVTLNNMVQRHMKIAEREP